MPFIKHSEEQICWRVNNVDSTFPSSLAISLSEEWNGLLSDVTRQCHGLACRCQNPIRKITHKRFGAQCLHQIGSTDHLQEGAILNSKILELREKPSKGPLSRTVFFSSFFIVCFSSMPMILDFELFRCEQWLSTKD